MARTTASKWLNEIVKYGGEFAKRADMIRDLETRGITGPALLSYSNLPAVPEEIYAKAPAYMWWKFEGEPAKVVAKNSFQDYMLASRKLSMKTLHSYDQQLGRMYLNLAAQVKSELSYARGFERYHLSEVLRGLTQAASDTTRDFTGLINKAMLESADIKVDAFTKGMQQYFATLDNVSPSKLVFRVPQEAVQALYARTYQDGLYLSERIWNLGLNTQSGLSRIVSEGLARGFHYDDPRIAQQVDRFLQPTRMGVKVKPSVTRTLKDGTKYTYRQRPVSYDAARLLRTEYCNAYREADHRLAERNPACYGELWSLSMEHPDIGCACEDYAQHDEGLGEGVFAIENTPMTPHCCCLCDQSQIVIPVEEFMGWAEDYMDGKSGPISEWVNSNGDALTHPPFVPSTPQTIASKDQIQELLTNGLPSKDLWNEGSAKAAKSEISDYLQAKLERHPDFHILQNYFKDDPLAFMSKGQNEATQLINSWAETSMDHSPLAQMLQNAAKEEFGLKSATTDRISNTLIEQHSDLNNIFKSFLRDQYNWTQEKLSRQGIDHIELFRGMRLTDATSPVAKGEIKSVRSSMQPLSSWSTNRKTAEGFAKKRSAERSVIAKIKVPKNNILSFPRTGFGCLNEREFVMFGKRCEVLFSDITSI